MDSQLLIICVLTLVIHLIGTLAYALSSESRRRSRRMSVFRTGTT
jgi:hypothetical protein